MYAANGIGATLAEMGHLEAAGAVFSEVVAAVAASNGFLQVRPGCFLGSHSGSSVRPRSDSTDAHSSATSVHNWLA